MNRDFVTIQSAPIRRIAATDTYILELCSAFAIVYRVCIEMYIGTFFHLTGISGECTGELNIGLSLDTDIYH